MSRTDDLQRLGRRLRARRHCPGGPAGVRAAPRRVRGLLPCGRGAGGHAGAARRACRPSRRWTPDPKRGRPGGRGAARMPDTTLPRLLVAARRERSRSRGAGRRPGRRRGDRGGRGARAVRAGRTGPGRTPPASPPTASSGDTAGDVRGGAEPAQRGTDPGGAAVGHPDRVTLQVLGRVTGPPASAQLRAVSDGPAGRDEPLSRTWSGRSRNDGDTGRHDEPAPGRDRHVDIRSVTSGQVLLEAGPTLARPGQ